MLFMDIRVNHEYNNIKTKHKKIPRKNISLRGDFIRTGNL